MFRRKFIAQLTWAGASGLSAVKGATHSGDTETVTYRIKGFTCIACAVGLDTMLSQHSGVVHSKSSYPDATSVIEFRPGMISENDLRTYISEMGFSVSQARSGGSL